VLLSIIVKLGENPEYKQQMIAVYADQLMTLFLQVLSCNTASVQEDALQAIGGLVRTRSRWACLPAPFPHRLECWMMVSLRPMSRAFPLRFVWRSRIARARRHGLWYAITSLSGYGWWLIPGRGYCHVLQE
jgi:hypothetical protein